MMYRNRFHNILVLLLTFVICAICLTANVAMAQKYPTSYDLTQIYASVEEWQADYDKVEQLIQGHSEYRGRLNNAETILEYYERFYMGELTELQYKLNLYVKLGTDLNLVDADYANMNALLTKQNSEETQLSAFADEEIYALPLETRKEIFSDPILEQYAYAFKQYVDEDHDVLSEDSKNTLAILEPALGRAQYVYSILKDVEFPVPTIDDPDGNLLSLDAGTYSQIIYSDEYDRDFKAKCYEALLMNYGSFANTFAALLDSNTSMYWAQAQLDGYATTREAALAEEDVDTEIYDMIISASHKGIQDYQRYLSAHARGLGLDKQYPFELDVRVSDYDPGYIEYDDAVDDVRNALSVLGEDYIALYDEMVTGSRIDVYPADNKISGGYSNGGVMPYIMLNYTGSTYDVGSLAHEMGHAIYSIKSGTAQNAMFNTPTAFTQEVASTTNELLYYAYKVENSADDSEKLYYLEETLSMFTGTLFDQAIYAEFEDYLYTTVEAGASLDAETLSDKWSELFNTYRGDTMEQMEGTRYQWTYIPHLYYNYYVYKYATSICYAAALCEAIKTEQPNAVKNYMQFLTLGCSNSPDNLLTVAGVNPLDEATYDNALKYFAELVDQYEELIDAR